MDKIKYSLSCGNFGYGKSICLWRTTKNSSIKIAKFQNDKAARMFAEEFQFPLNDDVKKRLSNRKTKWQKKKIIF